MGSRDLKPCPFCGGDNVVLHQPTCKPSTPYNPSHRLYPTARCSSCGAESYGDNEDYRGRSAVEAWNRRASPTGEAEPTGNISAEEERVERERLASEPAPVDTGESLREAILWIQTECMPGWEGKLVAKHVHTIIRAARTSGPSAGEPVDLTEVLGECVHTAFRKGADGPEAGLVWVAIRDMPGDQWGKAVDWMVWALRESVGPLYAHPVPDSGSQDDSGVVEDGWIISEEVLPMGRGRMIRFVVGRDPGFEGCVPARITHTEASNPDEWESGTGHIKVEDGTVWPHPDRMAEIDYRLRHNSAPLTRSARLQAASGLSAYVALAVRPDMGRKPVMIRRALARLTDTEPRGTDD